jgi:hypothetical protein
MPVRRLVEKKGGPLVEDGILIEWRVTGEGADTWIFDVLASSLRM